MEFRRTLNRYLDKHVHTNIHMFGNSWCAFQFWLYTGWVLAIVITITFSFYLELSPMLMSLSVVVAVLSSLGLGMATKIITGEEQYVLYQHAIALLAGVALLLFILGQPILPYLDLTALGLSIGLAAGRMGCFMVGCCHGRPSRWGVRYRREHADTGFPYYYVGVRVFPVQLLESFWALLTTSFLIFILLNGQAPGTCLTWYIAGYGAGRFLIEFLRGDPERFYFWGFSEAQWTALALIGFVVCAEFTARLPFQRAHLIIFAGMLLVTFAVSLKHYLQRETTHQLFYAPHLGEMAEAISLITDKAADLTPRSVWSVQAQEARPRKVHLVCTSLGLQISAGTIEDVEKATHHYAISQRDGLMNRKTAEALAKLFLQLLRTKDSTQLLEGKNGVFHLLIDAGNTGI